MESELYGEGPQLESKTAPIMMKSKLQHSKHFEANIEDFQANSDEDVPGKEAFRVNEQVDYKKLAKEAYCQLLKSGGGKSWNRSKLMLVGEGRAGKTSTLRCLMGKDFDAEERSTVGCATDVCKVDRGDIKGWKDYDGGAEYERAVADLALEQQAKGSSGGDSSYLGEHSVEENEIVRGAVSKLNDDLVLQAKSDRNNNSIILSTWDYAGQRVFYSVHHLFLTRNGAYLIVFSMVRLLDPKAQEETLDYLTFWLNSIFAHARDATVILVGTHRDRVPERTKHEKASQIISDAFGSSPAFAQVTGTPDGLHFFPLDNTRTLKDNGAEVLSNTILRCVSESECVQRQVPLLWLALFDKLLTISSNAPADSSAKRQTISLDEACALAREAGMPSIGITSLQEEVREALKLFHNLGHVIYYDDEQLRNLVVLDPQWLIDVITVVIREYTNDLHRLPIDREARATMRRDWDDLVQRGIVSAALLNLFWNKYTVAERNSFSYLMEKFGLMAPFRRHIKGHEKHMHGPGLGGAAKTKPKRFKSRVGSTEQKIDDLQVKYLVPSLLPRLDPAPAPTAPNPVCYIVFGQPIDGTHNNLVHIDSLTETFLPDGLFGRLLSRMMVWSQETYGFAELYANHASVALGELRFQFTYEASRHHIRVEVLVRNAEAVIRRLRLSLDAVIAECCPSLKYQMYVSPTSSPTHVIEYEQLQTVIGAHGTIYLDRQPVPLSAFETWLPSHGLLDSYDIFISYRTTSDQEFAMKLYDCFTNSVVGQDGRPLRVFYDKVRLEDGRRWDKDFMAALASSSIVVPIVSAGALQPMLGLEQRKDQPDNVLLEWWLAIHLAEVGRVKKVIPILLGEMDSSMDGAKPSEDSGHMMRSLLTSPVLASLPRSDHPGTLKAWEEFVSGDLGLATPDHMRDLTVHGVVDVLLKYQALLGWRILANLVQTDDEMAASAMWGLHEHCADHITHLVRQLPAPPSTTGPVPPPAPPPAMPPSGTTEVVVMDGPGERRIGRQTSSSSSRRLPGSTKLMVFVRSLDGGQTMITQLEALGVTEVDDLAYLRPKEVQQLKRHLKVVGQRKLDAAVVTARKKSNVKTAACILM